MNNMSREQWVMSNPTFVNYNQAGPRPPYQPAFGNTSGRSSFGLQNSNPNITPPKPQSMPTPQVAEKYNPFVEDDMEIVISDDENEMISGSNISGPTSSPKRSSKSKFGKELVEVQSGAAFYKGLILYIPPFEQVANTYRGSPAMKMLYASFEFSFKMPIRIETKMNQGTNNMGDATVLFRDEVLATASGWAPHVVASVRSLELLSETCYTIQAKEDYYTKCKLIDAETMKTLNLKKWEAVSEKYPKLVDITKDSHIQKTFSVFLDGHTSGGAYEDIVICNLTRQNVSDIKRVVEFFHLTMLPCSVSTKVAKKQTPCVVSIHKYTSAQKLLNILIECGGENDNFILYPPDTFKDFYKLHYSFWDPYRKKPEVVESKTTLDDDELQELVMKPYENMISELFEKYKLLGLPKPDKKEENGNERKVGDDFMKETLKIDMATSKNLAPVERMQLLLKYMEQLQEYGSRVLTSGHPEMIKIYHNAIDNLRKDLDTCRQDIEKEQKEKSSGVSKSSSSNRSRSPQRRKLKGRSKSPVRRRSKSPARRRSKSPVRRKSRSPVRGSVRSNSPTRRGRSRSPRRPDRTRKSVSPLRRPKSPRRAISGRRYSPPKRESHIPQRPRSPPRRSPPRRSPPRTTKEDLVIVSIFKDQFRRFVEALRRFRIEIEDTPIERRSAMKDKLLKSKEQLKKFYTEAMDNKVHLGEYLDEMVILKEEIDEQEDMIAGKPGPNDLPRSITPPPWMRSSGPPLTTTYPLPGSRYDTPPWSRPMYPPGYGPPMRPPYGYPY